MIALCRQAIRRLHRFRRAQDGTATIEFVMLFTPIILLMMSGAEAGLLNLRHVMLERGLDIAVRQVRLGPKTPPDHEALKKMVCDNAYLIPDCMNALAIEMSRVSKQSWNLLDATPVCRDRSEEIKPMTRYLPGAPSDLMIVRACVKAQPIFPAAALGGIMQKDAYGDYAFVSVSAFVNEPL